MSRRAERSRGVAVRILLALLSLVLLLAAGELALRTWVHHFREEVAVWDDAAATFALVPGHHRTAMGVMRVNEAGFAGGPLEAAGPDLWRIVAMGDSCTFGAGDGEGSYPAMLDRLLASEERPGRRYEVVNGGISGLYARDVLRRLRSAVPPLEPDVVTLYVGWNDLMKLSPRAQQPAMRLSRTALALDRLWLMRGLRKLVFYHLRPRVAAPATGAASDTGRFDRFRPVRYEETLRATVRAARGLGAEPLLVTLPTVLRSWMNRGELARARVAFPYLRSVYGVGDFLDLLAAYNRSVRRVASEESTALLDPSQGFRGLPEPRPYFYDAMHPNPRGMERVARWLRGALRREGLLGPLAATAPGSAAPGPGA